MLKKEVKYQNYNGEDKVGTYLFNYSRSEILEMDLSLPGGLKVTLERLVAHKDDRPKELVDFFKKFVLDAYGVKSEDGERFVKTEELKTAFYQSEAYTELFLELTSGEEAITAFVNGVIPNVPDPATKSV